MELLVATLAHMVPTREADSAARMRQIADGVRSAPGVIALHSYRGRQQGNYFLLLATWEDMDNWQKDQEKYDPRQKILAMADLLLMPPEQWLMHYQWGYRRPAKEPTVLAAHIITLQAKQADSARRELIANLRRQIAKPNLAYAFLAQEVDRDATTQLRAIKPQQIGTPRGEKGISPHGTTLLNFLSWGSETERDQFYRDPHYQTIKNRLERLAVTRILPLEQM